MTEVRHVTVQIRPSNHDDPGQVTTGYFTLEDNVLTMTTSSGLPIRRATTGERFTCKIKPGDNHVAIAGQLTLQVRDELRGENRPGAVKGFNRQLDYQNTRWR